MEQKGWKILLRPATVGRDHGVGMQDAAFAELHVFANDGVGADGHAGSDLGSARDDRLGVDGWRGHFADVSRFRGGVAWLKSIAIDHPAHEGGFGAELAIDGGSAFEFAEIAAPENQVHLKAQLVAGNDRTAEARVVHGHEVEQFFVAVGNFEQAKQAAGLRHGFDDQHARHDRFAGEMALEIGFVDADVFDADDTFQRFDLQDAIHH